MHGVLSGLVVAREAITERDRDRDDYYCTIQSLTEMYMGSRWNTCLAGYMIHTYTSASIFVLYFLF